MKRRCILIGLAFLFQACSSQSQKNNNNSTWRSKWVRPEDFVKLKLDVLELRGSRWTLEQKTAVAVYHSIEIVDATLINRDELTLRVEFNLRQTWHAEDMEFPEGLFTKEDDLGAFVTAEERVLRNMWSPDSYISTAREAQLATTKLPLSLVYIFKNRTIIYKVRMFTRVACSSNFQWYPLDVQSCELVIESYKYHDNIVNYLWTDPKLYRPVTIYHRRQFQYHLRDSLQYDNGTVERGGRGMLNAFVRVNFTFERKLGNNVIQIFTPTILVIVLSWFSFFLGLDAIPGRISLLVTCMLTLVTMHSGIKSTIPPVDYITMMDVWIVCCMAFVFTAVCEFVLVKYLHWRQQMKQKVLDEKQRQETTERLYSIMEGKWNARKESDFSENPFISPSNGNDCKQVTVKTEKKAVLWNWAVPNDIPNTVPDQILRSIIVDTVNPVSDDYSMDDKESKEEITSGENNDAPVWIKIDRLCRGLFPGLFCIFNAVYWPMLILGSLNNEHEHQH